MISISENLDGNRDKRGQGQGGNFDSEYYQMLKKEYAHLAPYVTDVIELDILWDADHTIPGYSYERWVTKLKAEAILQKVDWEAVDAKVSAKLNVLKLGARKQRHANHELGAREFTLTYSPNWFTDTVAREKMTKAIDKLLKYYADDIVQLRAIGEVGTNGLSHVHCFYKLRGGLKIKDKNFKRAWPHWNPQKRLGYKGFEGGHHECVKSESDFLGYIDKDVDVAWLERNVDCLSKK